MHKHKLKAVIDFVPNHVARSYSSDVRPELSFGKDDDTAQFYTPDNNFFYLGDLHQGGGAPLRLPTKNGAIPYPPESKFGRVTGNNVISWTCATGCMGKDTTLKAARDPTRRRTQQNKCKWKVKNDNGDFARNGRS